jgi:hypothetical protein
MDEQAKIKKDVVTKFEAMEKILKNLDDKWQGDEGRKLYTRSVHRDEDVRDASGTTCGAPDG